jgi:hypothetical protein
MGRFGIWSLKDRAENSPAKQTQQNKQQKIATDDPVVASPQVAAIPVKAKQQPEDHKHPEQNSDRHFRIPPRKKKTRRV